MRKEILLTIQIKYTLGLIVLLIVSTLILSQAAQAITKTKGEPKPTSGLIVQKITIGEESLPAGRNQLVEVLIKNITQKNIPVVVKLVVTLPNHNIITFGAKKSLCKAKTETRVLLPYPVPKNREGDFTVSARLFSPGNKVLAQSSKNQSKFFFAYGRYKKKRGPQRGIKQKDGQKLPSESTKPKVVAAPLQFDPPDLVFKEVGYQNNNSVLRGETAHIKLVLLNDGGDVATDVDYSLYWYYGHRPRRKINFEKNTIKVIAPGERKIIELPLTIPETELIGEYIIQASLDEREKIKELNENNNATLSSLPLIFSDISLIFPEESHSFAEDGRFLFQWRSIKYNQFKVHVSLNKDFPDTDDTFEIPKGEKWESAKIIKPLAGEIKMAINLMESNSVDHLYWRVKARNSRGEITESGGRKFFVKLIATSE